MPYALAALIACLTAAAPEPAGTIRNIPADWKPSGLCRLPIASSSASSTFMPETNQYASAKAFDGDRRSKWVASIEPTAQSPQWITVELAGGVRTVSAVAVFGEAINNDGILAAQIQVADLAAREFRTVATLADATSASWLASFPPVRTSAVRLLITRSAGPSANTDVYEVEVLGPAPSIGDLRQHAAQVRSTRQGILDASRHLFAGAESYSKVTCQREGGAVRLFNNTVAVTVSEADGTWDAVWPAGLDAAIRHADFSLQIDGNELRPKDARTETQPFSGKLGAGIEIRQAWGDKVRVERVLRVYDRLPAVTLAGCITNGSDRDITLGTTRMLSVSDKNQGWWQAGSMLQSPGAVFVNSGSEWLCEPVGTATGDSSDRSYSGTGVLALAGNNPRIGFICGYLTAAEARPDLSAGFRPSEGGISLRAELAFLDRKLAPGRSLDLDTVYLAACDDPYTALERYGDAAAAFARYPVRKDANSLWCSWYAHRMSMTEDRVLANAAVIARHFQPLGMDLVQLDHGWQRGDITGDWIANDRFPHGLKWLSEQLQSRFGLKLGVWIAPTDVAETSELFKIHRDWMLKDDKGNPRVNWKWYWKPNPDCYELDASNPAAAKWIEDTFARLTAEGVRYYKIDFIAGSGAPHFRQSDPYCTRGWSVLNKAMTAIRTGAGPDAWIRYCQTPPLLAAGLADSAYGGNDTLDAGLGGHIDVFRTNARSLAASYWLNDRLYHREVCDMSVRMQGDVEEIRMRLALMTLADCSISFSDEFQYLPPSRIRMMQQCLPPGNPPMKPIDLFERTIPSIWQIHCKNAADEWDVIAFFNFEDKPQDRTIDFTRLGLPVDADVLAFEFWESNFIGQYRGSITLALPAQSSRILALRRATGRPQVVGTDMHLLQGYHELRKLAWDDKARTLSVQYRRAAGLQGRAFLYVPAGHAPHFDFPLAETSARLTHVKDRLWMQEIDFAAPGRDCSIRFDAVATQPADSQPPPL